MDCDRDENGNIIDPLIGSVIPEDGVIVLNNVCIDIEVLTQYVITSGKTINPFTRQELPKDVLLLMEKYRNYHRVFAMVINKTVKPLSENRERVIMVDGFVTVGDLITRIVKEFGLQRSHVIYEDRDIQSMNPNKRIDEAFSSNMLALSIEPSTFVWYPVRLGRDYVWDVTSNPNMTVSSSLPKRMSGDLADIVHRYNENGASPEDMMTLLMETSDAVRDIVREEQRLPDPTRVITQLSEHQSYQRLPYWYPRATTRGIEWNVTFDPNIEITASPWDVMDSELKDIIRRYNTRHELDDYEIELLSDEVMRLVSLHQSLPPPDRLVNAMDINHLMWYPIRNPSGDILWDVTLDRNAPTQGITVMDPEVVSFINNYPLYRGLLRKVGPRAGNMIRQGAPFPPSDSVVFGLQPKENFTWHHTESGWDITDNIYESSEGMDNDLEDAINTYSSGANLSREQVTTLRTELGPRALERFKRNKWLPIVETRRNVS